MHWWPHPTLLAGSYQSHVGFCQKSSTADPACCWLCSVFCSQNIFCLSMWRVFIWGFGFQSRQDHYGVPSQEQVALGVFFSRKVSSTWEAPLFLSVTQTKCNKSKFLNHTKQSISILNGRWKLCKHLQQTFL